MTQKLVKIGTYASLPEASIVQGMLQANGIPVMLKNVEFNAIYPMGSPGFGIDLYVAAADAPQALKLLHQHGDDN